MMKSIKVFRKWAVIFFLLAFAGCSGGGSGDGGGGGSGGGDDSAPVDFTQGSDTPMPGQGVDLNLNPDDPLVLTATDDDGLFYSFFGAKESDGSVKYFDQLQIHELTDVDAAELYLLIDFDDQQRLKKITLPDLQGEIEFEYLDSTEVEATLLLSDGTTETIRIDNPFPAATSSSLLSKEVSVAATALDVHYKFLGTINVCEEGAAINMFVLRKHYYQPEHPGVLIFPKVMPFNDPLRLANYRYVYGFDIPNQSLRDWQDECKKHKFTAGIKIVGGVAFPAYGAYETIRSGFDVMIKDLKANSGKDSSKKLIDTLTDIYSKKLLTGIPISNFVSEIGEYLERGGHGPCSPQAWDYKTRIATADGEIYCAYGNSLKTATHKVDLKTNDTEQLAPDFDFSEMCCDNVTEAGGDTPETHNHELGRTKGSFEFSYQTYTIKDRIQVIYEGSTKFDTGCVGASGTELISFEGTDHSVTVTVTPNCDGNSSGTAWNYSIGCP